MIHPMIESPSFIVRSGQASDRKEVLALVPRLRAFGPSALRPAEALDAGELETLERFFDTPTNGAVLFVAAAVSGEVLGAAYAEPAIDYFTKETHGHLGILVVAEEAEGRGIGRALVAAFEQWALAAGYRFVTLNVFAENTRATAVYKRAGYAADTVRYAKTLR